MFFVKKGPGYDFGVRLRHQFFITEETMLIELHLPNEHLSILSIHTGGGTGKQASKPNPTKTNQKLNSLPYSKANKRAPKVCVKLKPMQYIYVYAGAGQLKQPIFPVKFTGSVHARLTRRVQPTDRH